MSAEPTGPDADVVTEATTRRRRAAMQELRRLHERMRARTGDGFVEVDDVLEEVRYGDLRDE